MDRPPPFWQDLIDELSFEERVLKASREVDGLY
jgi:hypothetical protein